VTEFNKKDLKAGSTIDNFDLNSELPKTSFFGHFNDFFELYSVQIDMKRSLFQGHLRSQIGLSRPDFFKLSKTKLSPLPQIRGQIYSYSKF